ncbi:biotin-dependent carboxyltransferase family protein [Ectobacillus polymachus]|uniref:5-oxoprolinase subunit C family protein n=1 Tax=Ectobacillus polymachus TaxID=1508806 RepID=UPI003A84C9E3
MSIQVLKPGLFTTIQDLGRTGFQKHGVIISGVMDSYSSRIANVVIGNKESEAVLEITVVGPSLLFEKSMVISITGGDLSPTIDGRLVPMGRPVYVKEGSILKFGSCQSGCRAYLAVGGGFSVPKVLNSKSTYLLGKLGGYKGRALDKEDRLLVGPISDVTKRLIKKLENQNQGNPFSTTNWFVPSYIPANTRKIRVIRGEHFEAFTEVSQEQLFTEAFTISSQSNRMGYRVSGAPLQLQKPFELLSEAVCHGTIQVPPEGNPIILLADRQTTGGYPRMAQVVTADLPILAQMKPGDQIRFQLIGIKEAERLLLQRELQMKQLKRSLFIQER